jgi:GLPGLI family protein
MKRILLVLSVLLVSLQCVSAQGLRVVYEEVSNPHSGRDVSKDYDNVDNPEVREYLEKQAKSPKVRTSELLVNKGVSLYTKNKEQEKSDVASLEGERFKANMNFTQQNIATSAIYKNYIDSIAVTQTNVNGKIYLVESPISGKSVNWEITPEQQNILGYNCIKATRIVGQAQKIGNLETKQRKVFAWYCPDIPVDAGPESYGGLPGLILKTEVEDGIQVCTATSIEAVDSTTEIPKPDKGEKVSSEEFIKIVVAESAKIFEKIKQGGGNVRIIQK